MAKEKKHSSALKVLKMKDKKTGKPIFSKDSIKFGKKMLRALEEQKLNEDYTVGASSKRGNRYYY